MSTPQLTQAQIIGDPRTYVLTYLQTHQITVNERGELKDGTLRNNLDVFDTMYLDYLSQVKNHNAQEKLKAAALRNPIAPVAEKVLQKALQELITKEKLAYRKKVLNSFKCTTEDLTLVKKYVKALTGAEDPDDVAVIAHWMWQVKTKMMDKSPSYHIMPIYYGRQGGGKTVAMTKLIAPINNFRLNINMDQMTDDRYFKSMSENYVIVFDEMQGAERSDIDALKKQVTIDYNDYRPMGTNEVYKVKQACSFIGATNRQVAEQIVDTTGMRRFWQINCLDKLDWEALNSIDYQAMWIGIDENKVDGYMLEQIVSISAKQEEMVAKDDISMFMDELGIIPGKAPTKEVSSGLIYGEYKEFCERNGFKAMSSSWFGRKLVGRGVTKGVKTVNGKTINFFNINQEVKLGVDYLMDEMDKKSNVVPHRGLGQARA